ncbi:MAG: hypothetical protein WCA46_06425, partial [Actinocatenispora sp.]
VALASAGCGAGTTTVTAPPFTVPTPSTFDDGGPDRPGSAAEATRFLSGWMHSLSQVHQSDGHRTLVAACHGDERCLALVRQARSLPVQKDPEIARASWTLQLDDVVTPDPQHRDSWVQVVRPVWKANGTPFGGYDGWTTPTMLRVRMAKIPDGDWRLWITPDHTVVPPTLALKDPELR